MPITLKHLVDQVSAKLDSKGPAWPMDLETIVRATVEGVGLCIADNGEVTDPRPVANPWEAPKQTTAYWSGGRRNRRR